MERVYELNGINTIAKELAPLRENHKVWAFEGDLGAGKTTLIHAVCDEMGIQGNFGSPTFSIINEYISGGAPVYHIDLYRCKNEDEAVRAGVEDCLYSGNFCMVEWPSRAPGIFPENTLRITITVTGEFTRSIRIVNHSAIHA